MELTVIAMDIAKKVFQLHWVELETGSIERLKLKRAQVLPWFANRRTVAGRDGSMRWRSRLGTRAANAWVTKYDLSRPRRFVRSSSATRPMPRMRRRSGQPASSRACGSSPVKSEAQQVVLSLHRLRAQLMKMRIMQTNELRGLLYEFGIVLPKGTAALLKALPAALLRSAGQIASDADRQPGRAGSANPRNSRPTSARSSADCRSSCATHQRARRSPRFRASG